MQVFSRDERKPEAREFFRPCLFYYC